MNIKDVIELMGNELNCIKRNIDGCDRDCGKCDLVKTDEELLLAFNLAIKALEKQIPKKVGETLGDYENSYYCDRCGRNLRYEHQKYCEDCGGNQSW